MPTCHEMVVFSVLKWHGKKASSKHITTAASRMSSIKSNAFWNFEDFDVHLRSQTWRWYIPPFVPSSRLRRPARAWRSGVEKSHDFDWRPLLKSRRNFRIMDHALSWGLVCHFCVSPNEPRRVSNIKSWNILCGCIIASFTIHPTLYHVRNHPYVPGPFASHLLRSQRLENRFNRTMKWYELSGPNECFQRGMNMRECGTKEKWLKQQLSSNTKGQKWWNGLPCSFSSLHRPHWHGLEWKLPELLSNPPRSKCFEMTSNEKKIQKIQVIPVASISMECLHIHNCIQLFPIDLWRRLTG